MSNGKWNLIFPNIYQIHYMVLVFAGSSASCERTFTYLDFIKNSLRSTMIEERMESLLICFSNKDILEAISHYQIMVFFNSMKNRWLKYSLEEN